MMLTGLIISVILNLLASIYDVAQTEKGLAKGVAREGNWFTKLISGTDKPSTKILTLWNIAFIAGMLGAAWLGSIIVHDVAGFLPSTIILVGDAAKHMRGGLYWRWLLAGGAYREPDTILEKIVGIWHFLLPKK